MKKQLLGLGTMVAVGMPTASVIACNSAHEKDYAEYKLTKDASKDYAEYKLTKDASLTLESTLENRDANGDLAANIYFPIASYGYSISTRHAFLSKNNAIFYKYAKAAHISHTSFVDKLQTDKFIEFKDSLREVVGPHDQGTIEFKDIMNASDFFLSIKNLIEENPNKSFNVYLNKLHYASGWKSNGIPKSWTKVGSKFILDRLLEYPNVNIHLYEDGSINEKMIYSPSPNYRNKHEKHTQDNYISKFDHVFSYSDLAEENSTFKTFELYDTHLSEMGDKIFNDKSPVGMELSFMDTTNPTRYFKIFPSILGIEMKDIAKSIDDIKNIPSNKNKETLMILGSYGASEIGILNDAIQKYGKDHIIFYKGHPGHKTYTSEVINKINDGETDWTKQKVIVLDPDIASEEYTNSYAVGTKDFTLNFNKFLAIGHTGALTTVSSNGFNTMNSIIGWVSKGSPNIDDIKSF